ncbi:MAG: DUF1285 domain-containing protein [Syntrophobacterales bacterium]|nr:DUF1285 domain-containing protein [Syntrophobacterales bacterium]
MDIGSNRTDLLKKSLMEPSGITVDEEGNWFYHGNPIIREDILQLFYDHLRFIPGNGYVIEWDNAFHPIKVADTPFVVTRVDTEKGKQTIKSISITLKHLPNTVEILDPSTLFVGKDNILYCKIRNGSFVARFSRPAYYQVAELIKEKNGEFFIETEDGHHVIKINT